MPTSLETLAEFIADLKFASLPEPTVRAARLCILDSIGCAVGGWNLPLGRVMAEFVAGQGGAAQATVMGSGTRLPVDRVAYLNAYLANLLDFDDMLPIAGHLGTTVVPPALALAEHRGCDGYELIRAVVCGYEIGARIARAGHPSPGRQAVVRGHSTWQVFSTTAAAGALLGLTPLQLANALGLAAVHAPVPSVGRWYERPVHHVKNNYGWIAQAGLTAALLAGRGLEGKRGVLDGGPGAFWDMAGSDRWQPEEITRDLGERFWIEEVRFKELPACWHMQSALAGVGQIMAKADFELEDIESIEIASVPYIQNFADYAPASPIDCQFSLPYSGSMVLLRKTPGPAWFDAGLLADDTVRTLASKVRLNPHGWKDATTPGHIPAEVRISMRGGQSYTAAFQEPPGEKARNPPEEALAYKFIGLVSSLLGEHEARSALTRIQDLPDGKIGPDWIPSQSFCCSLSKTQKAHDAKM